MFGMSTKTVVGLDVGSFSVKAVALTPNRDRITLSGYAQARIGASDPAMVVRQVLDQLGVKPKQLVSAVSGRSVIVRQVETPKLSGDELKAHITYEADKYIPFGTDEVIIDCQPLPEREGTTGRDNTQQVLLVAVRRGFVEDHLNMLRSAGLWPDVIDVDVFAVANAYELFGPAPSTSTDATALIDIGASKSNIAIVDGKRLLFTREVYLAGNEITDAIVRTFNEQADEVERIKTQPAEALEAMVDAAMPAFEDLANEIRLSFDYVEGQFEKQVGAVVLTGGTSLLPTIGEILGNILGRPVHVFDPLAGLDLIPSKYDIHSLDANAPGLTIALGLAAHLLGSTASGLGGAQSHAWQPRNDAGSTARTAPVAPEEAGGEEDAAPPPIDDRPLPMPTPSGPQSLGPPPMTTPVPPPPVTYTPVPPPPSLATPPPPPPGADPQNRGATSQFFQNTEGGKSGLLVILDDDQDIPQSERVEKKTGTQRKPTIKLENFDEGDPGLPGLPKI